MLKDPKKELALNHGSLHLNFRSCIPLHSIGMDAASVMDPHDGLATDLEWHPNMKRTFASFLQLNTLQAGGRAPAQAGCQQVAQCDSAGELPGAPWQVLHDEKGVYTSGWSFFQARCFHCDCSTVVVHCSPSAHPCHSVLNQWLRTSEVSSHTGRHISFAMALLSLGIGLLPSAASQPSAQWRPHRQPLFPDGSTSPSVGGWTPPWTTPSLLPHGKPQARGGFIR